MADVRLVPCPRRIRAVLHGITVIDSIDAQYGYRSEGPPYPAYYVPEEHVRRDVLDAAGVSDAVFDLRDGFLCFRWSAFDAVFEESEQVYVHARDPMHRVDVLQSDRLVEISVDGVQVASSSRPKMLFETGLPTRYYLPKFDVRMELLSPTSTQTGCPYKGFANYWAVEVGDTRHDDLVWSYRTPVAAALEIAGLVCFYNEKVDITVDNEPQPRPVTHFA